MTTAYVWQLSLIVAAGFFFLGALFGILVISYGKNGLFETRSGLTAERAENERLREQILTAATEGGASENPGHVDNAGTSSSDWNCEERGHRFAIVNEDGETKRKCLHCPQDGGSAA